jgi:hypothetical protein
MPTLLQASESYYYNYYYYYRQIVTTVSIIFQGTQGSPRPPLPSTFFTVLKTSEIKSFKVLLKILFYFALFSALEVKFIFFNFKLFTFFNLVGLIKRLIILCMIHISNHEYKINPTLPVRICTYVLRSEFQY